MSRDGGPGEGNVVGGSGLILLVDDEDLLRGILAEALEDEGYAVVQAEAGDTALDVLRAEPRINLMVTDIRMVGMTGLELATHARTLRPDLGIVLISGHFNADTPPHRFLRKPFNLADLIAAVEAERS